MRAGLLTLAEAQAELGIQGSPPGAKLRRVLQERERATGLRIMTRTRGRGRRAALRVTLGAIRRHCPELLPSKVDDLAKNFKAYLERIDERIADRVASHVSEQIEPRLDELWIRDEEIAGKLNDLAARVDRLAGLPK